MLSTSPDGNTLKYLDIPRALERVGDVQALRGMLPMLQELLDRDVPKIAYLLGINDVRGASPLLHAFKGCMPIFCSSALCENLERVEHLSRSGDGPEVGQAYAVLMPELQTLQREIARYLALSPDVG